MELPKCLCTHWAWGSLGWQEGEAEVAAFGMSLECLCLVRWKLFLTEEPKDIIITV